MFTYHEVTKELPLINTPFYITNLNTFLNHLQKENLFKLDEKNLVRGELRVRRHGKQKYLQIYEFSGFGGTQLRYQFLYYDGYGIIIDIHSCEHFTNENKYLEFGVKNYCIQFYNHAVLRDFTLIYLLFGRDIYDDIKKEEKQLVIDFNVLTDLLFNGVTFKAIKKLKHYTIETLQSESYILDCIINVHITSESFYMSKKGQQYLIKKINKMGYLEFMRSLCYEKYDTYERIKHNLYKTK